MKKITSFAKFGSKTERERERERERESEWERERERERERAVDKLLSIHVCMCIHTDERRRWYNEKGMNRMKKKRMLKGRRKKERKREREKERERERGAPSPHSAERSLCSMLLIELKHKKFWLLS